MTQYGKRIPTDEHSILAGHAAFDTYGNRVAVPAATETDVILNEVMADKQADDLPHTSPGQA